MAADLVLASDETRNYGETDRELLLRPEAEVVLGRDVRRCWPTARFVRFPQPDAAEPSPRTHRSAPRHGERNSGAPIAVAQPRAYALPGPSSAATSVDLAAAIAQEEASGSTPAEAL
jgi:hypothetical protein